MKKANHSGFLKEYEWQIEKKNHIFYMCTNASKRALLNILNGFLKSVTV